MHLPIYLDYMATTPVDKRVAAKMQACLDIDGNFGNPAASHIYGWHAEEAIKLACQQVADLICADSREIIWTSGATEAINLALQGAAHFYQRQGKHIITCKTEHHAVLDTCQHLQSEGFDITFLDPEENGLIDLNKLANALRDDTILVSIMHVNNEIGVIQDIQSISNLTRPRGILLHVDAAQSVGKIPIDLRKLNVDLMSFSAHKVYGPKGAGALWVRRKPKIHLQPLLFGGGHQHGMRSGTLATHQIVGMGEAFYIAQQEMATESVRLQQLRDRLWQGIQTLPQLYLNGDYTQRIPGNLNVSVAGVDGEALLMSLKDLAVSSGAACTSAAIEPSHVLRALGRSDELAYSTIRFSIGRFTTEAEIDYAIKQFNNSVEQLRKTSPLWQQQT